MDRVRSLSGSCSCGRYEYAVTIPENDAAQAQLSFVTDNEHRRSTSSLLNSYLRVPLHWYTSRTVSHFPDETHHTIARTFTPPHQPYCQRKFCGYCGTHVTYWTEKPRQEKEYLNINIGSLHGNDLRFLEDLGLLDSESDHENELAGATESQGLQQFNPTTKEVKRTSDDGTTDLPVHTIRSGKAGDLTWFEDIISGSRLGRRCQTRRGQGTTPDGTTTVSWEVSEYASGDLETPESMVKPSKRKLADVTDNDANTV